MPRWGRPPGAHLGRPNGRRGGQWADGGMRVEEMVSETEEQFGRGDKTLHTKQLAGPRQGGNGWRSSMMEYDGHYATEPTDGADYDMYEDTNSTVAYAVELAMKDNEDWLVERALERIRRAHSEGNKNVTLSQRELKALERRRLQDIPASAVENRRMDGVGSGIGVALAPSYPLDTSVPGTWARTTSAAISPESPMATPRSPLQPLSGSANRPPAFLAPPTISHSHPGNHQRISYQAPRPREVDHSLHRAIDPQRGSLTRAGQRPYSNVPFSSRTSLVPSDHPVLAPEPVAKKAIAIEAVSEDAVHPAVVTSFPWWKS
ncbi:uncharacterized protein BDV17DRAFT_34445 [Aspergillus undulatus]|uniref:uncharacterized protein n=1 Tax=Aspergillus undulatus TaxID=1810928 RepID=UPI003CCD8C6B